MFAQVSDTSTQEVHKFKTSLCYGDHTSKEKPNKMIAIRRKKGICVFMSICITFYLTLNMFFIIESGKIYKNRLLNEVKSFEGE